MDSKLLCIVGMCGSGKSTVTDYLRTVRTFGYVRFGQICLDKIKEMGEQPNEQSERRIREEMRQEYGMAAYAILNMPKFEEQLAKGDVIGDGLYSWQEYRVLKEKYGDNLIVVCVYAPPAVRYERLENRIHRHKDDSQNRFRSFPRDQAAARDIAEIENLDKGGPIAMADFTLINTGTIDDLTRQVDTVLASIYPN